ncbi:MAG: hypothetical protein P8Q37_00575 [Porticoccaceae bacterium]|nr:hypothetical protein [Porticoccaceae bacterium]MDG1473371.1 hypothetical protein [Porticoccaceae bacterium]
MKADKNHKQFLLKPSSVQHYLGLALIVAIACLLTVIPISIWPKYISVSAMSVALIIVQLQWYRRTNELLVYRSDAQPWLLLRKGKKTDLSLCANQFITTKLVVLHFKTLTGRSVKCFITRDRVSPREHHQLRTLLIRRQR